MNENKIFTENNPPNKKGDEENIKNIEDQPVMHGGYGLLNYGEFSNEGKIVENKHDILLNMIEEENQKEILKTIEELEGETPN
ncbi:MAG: hypothetical protein KAS01_00800 [Candidatus Pacebacteria bacterium]|nr:hypothetical protein [Candidatus Paceibacterota bacterium]